MVQPPRRMDVVRRRGHSTCTHEGGFTYSTKPVGPDRFWESVACIRFEAHIWNQVRSKLRRARIVVVAALAVLLWSSALSSGPVRVQGAVGLAPRFENPSCPATFPCLRHM